MRNVCFVGGEAEKTCAKHVSQVDYWWKPKEYALHISQVEKNEIEAEKNTVFVGGDSSMGTCISQMYYFLTI